MQAFNNNMLKRDKSRIGALPDSILHYILSLLDMSDVVKLSLVSKKWRYFWMSVPVLSFNDSMWVTTRMDKCCRYCKHFFMNFVDKVLLQHDGSNVDKLEISCSNFCDSDHIVTWLNGAASKKFKEIRLELQGREKLKIPYLVFSSAVTKFELVVRQSDFLVQLPSSLYSSPQLKTLILDSVDVLNKLSCPVLETLTLKQCRVNKLVILTPQLKNLVIEDTLCVIPELNIWAPDLVSLDWTGPWHSTHSLRKFSSLAIANLKFITELPSSQDLLKVLEVVSSARTLGLNGFFEHCIDFSDKSVSQFSRLRRLKVTSSYDNRNNSSCFILMLKLLKKAPLIETLVLEAANMHQMPYKEQVLPFKFCHLKSVEIGKLGGCEEEIRFLKVLLKNSPVLQNLEITMFPNSMDSVSRRKFSLKVLAEKGQFDVSEDIFTKVQEAASRIGFVQMADGWINLAHVYFAQGQFA